MKRSWGGAGAVLALAVLTTSCAHHRKPAPGPAPVPPAPTPTPPPEPEAPTINSGLGPAETLWHVRSALNVGALLCGHQPGGAGLVQRYNALLVNDKAVLATAYAGETQRFGSGPPAALDRHMTQLYNFFARPQSTVAFCAAAVEVSGQMATTPASGLVAAAPAALAKLQDAILHPPPVAAPVMAARKAEPAAAAAPGDWRIQLGAFTGRSAAEAAWAKVRAKLPSLAAYTPRYEAVPKSPLVRLQIGPAADRDGAIRLCAAAATGGFDCMPVGKSR
jgi:cell division septation protein DedD